MQALIAYSIVAIAVVYAAWLFMPQVMRRWLMARLVAIMPASRRGWLARLQASSEQTGCSTCKGCATDGKTASSSIKTIELRRH